MVRSNGCTITSLNVEPFERYSLRLVRKPWKMYQCARPDEETMPHVTSPPKKGHISPNQKPKLEEISSRSEEA